MSIRDDIERQKEIESLLADLEEPLERLSKWDEKFVESVSDQVAAGRRLSDKQLDTLRGIAERAC